MKTILFALFALLSSLNAQCYPNHPLGMGTPAGFPTGCNEIGPTTDIPFLSALPLPSAATGGPLTFTLSRMPAPASATTQVFEYYLAIDLALAPAPVQVPGSFSGLCDFAVGPAVSLTGTVGVPGFVTCPFLPSIPLPPLPFLTGLPLVAQATLLDPVQLQVAATPAVQFNL